jgi:pimeloyl-ACP methyl ester carboxylesterase
MSNLLSRDETMEVMPVAAVREQPVQFGRYGALVGVLSTPGTAVRRPPVLLLSGGIIHRVGPSRALVRIARGLAAVGHPCLRFDLSGIGDSARAPEPTLQDAAVADIGDAITLLQASTGDGGEGAEPSVTLLGFCSGADNALYVAADDPRVASLVLFDPTVPRTAGFRRRELHRRLSSHETFMNVVTGRSLVKRLAALRDDGPPVFPPEHYGLLTCTPDELDARVTRLSARGVRRLWVLSAGVTGYCNAPEQVEEALASGWNATLDTVAWEMALDHVLTTHAQQRRFLSLVAAWLHRSDEEATSPAASDTLATTSPASRSAGLGDD